MKNALRYAAIIAAVMVVMTIPVHSQYNITTDELICPLITEGTAGAGVTIDGMVIKDGMIVCDDSPGDEEFLTYEADTGSCEWQTGGGGGSGETNTGSNLNAAGVGVFDGKVGVDLQFRGINAGSSKITVSDDSGNDEIDIDVAEANLTITESQISDLAHTVDTDTGPGPDCTGTSTYQDGEGGCDAVGGDISGGLDAVVVANDSHDHTTTTISGLVEADITDLAHTADVSGATFLTTTSEAGLSAETVVGTTPGGELGGTWASPTVDSVHSGSAHHSIFVPSTDPGVDHSAFDEEVQDVAGAMATGNTETGIAVTYQDSDGTMDYVAEVTGSQFTTHTGNNEAHRTLDIQSNGVSTLFDIENLDFSRSFGVASGGASKGNITITGFPMSTGGAIDFSSSFACPLGAVACSGGLTNGDNLQRAPMTGGLKNLRINIFRAPGSGTSWTITLTKNGSTSTAITCTISNTNTACSDLSNTATITAGDTWGLEWAASGSPASTLAAMWSLTYTTN